VFASKACVPQPLTLYTPSPVTPQLLDFVSFSLAKVNNFLATLDSAYVTGPAPISARVLKTCSAAFTHPLSALFTQSFALGHLPCTWKSVYVTELHKCGAKTDPLNCRPISLFPIVGKGMESFITVWVRPAHSTLDMLLLLSQHGWRPSMSD